MNMDWIAEPGLDGEGVFPGGVDLIESIGVEGSWVCFDFGNRFD
jgi:hypothetical protein